MDVRGATARVDVHFPVPQIQEQIVEVIEVILQEQCQRMRLFTFERRVVQQLLTGVFWGCGSLAKARATARVDVPTTPRSRMLRFDSECKRWNPEHVVLDPFSHITPSALLLSLCSSVG